MEAALFPLWSEPVAVEVPKPDFLFTAVGVDYTCHSNRLSMQAAGTSYLR